MSDILGLAASAAGGGVFGLAGTVIGRVAGYFETKQANAHEKERWKHDEAMLQHQMTADRQRAEAELSKIEAEGSWDGLSASLRADAAIGESYRWVNAVRGLTRPVLTMALWLITLLVFFYSSEADRPQIINTATFAATAATLWWFGDRGPNRNPRFAGPTDRIAGAAGQQKVV